MEDSGKPTQLFHEGFFDVTIDDCDEEVSGGVSRVRRPNRRHLVLVPTMTTFGPTTFGPYHFWPAQDLTTFGPDHFF